MQRCAGQWNRFFVLVFDAAVYQHKTNEMLPRKTTCQCKTIKLFRRSRAVLLDGRPLCVCTFPFAASGGVPDSLPGSPLFMYTHERCTGMRVNHKGHARFDRLDVSGRIPSGI